MRIRFLDYLRGIAVLLVFGRHFDPIPTDLGWFNSPFWLWNDWGWFGVDLFFVLSGFLVSGLLMKEFKSSGQVKVKRFLIRRGFKIYPAFYVLLLITALLPIGKRPSQYPLAYLCELLYLQNYGPGIWAHTWTLAVEEHFYLVLSFFTFCAMKYKALRQPQLLLRLALTAIGLILVMRIVTWVIVDGNLRYFGASHLRFDAFIWGVMLAYFYHFRNEQFMGWFGTKPNLLLIGAFALLVPVLLLSENHPFVYTLGLTCLHLSFAIFIGVLLAKKPGNSSGSSAASLLLAPLAFVGFYSYSIYLWHMPVRRILPVVLERYTRLSLTGLQLLSLYMILSVVIGYVMARLVEIPMLAIRDKYFPSQSVPLRVTADQPSGQL